MDLFTIGWLIWIAYFLVLEAFAIFSSREGRTLSAHVWVWFGAGKDWKHNTWAWIRRTVLILFMIWLSLHFVFGVI